MSESPKEFGNIQIPEDFLSPPLSVEFVQEKISEFSQLFSGIYRIPLLNCEGRQKENVLHQLIILKNNVKYALEDLRKGCFKQDYHFTCGICDASIIVKAGQDFWQGLQTHEHFEELVSDFMQKKLSITFDRPAKIEQSSDYNETGTSGDSNTDSGIDQPEVESANDHSPNIEMTSPLHEITNVNVNDVPSTSRQRLLKDDVNGFRFNFPVKYCDSVASKIYPASLMEGVFKFDKVKDYFTIQKAGNSKAVCLVCPCELHNQRIHKKVLTDHALGHKHMTATSDHRYLDKLREYHEFWLKEEEFVQAHQVFFRMYDTSKMMCALCNVYVYLNEIRSHIKDGRHKNKVLDMYNKKNSPYHLIDLQVQLYGVVPTPPPEKEINTRNEQPRKEKPQNTSRTAKTDRKVNNSESDHAVDGQNDNDDEDEVTHSIIHSVTVRDSQNVFDLLPNRMKGCLKSFKRIKRQKSSFILCKLCNLELPEKLELLEEHIVYSPPHAYAQNVKYSYYCEICNKTEPSEIRWYKHNWNGPRHENMAGSRKARVAEYECTTCKLVIFGDELSLRRHRAMEDKVGKKRTKSGAPRLPDQVKQIFKNRDSILTEADKLKTSADEALLDNRTRECCDKIQGALREIYDHCKVYPFGSRVTGIGNKDSDLDVFVDIGGMFTGEKQQDAKDQVLILRHAAKAFTKKETSAQWTNIIKVDTARTPILKLHHIPTDLDCDLSFRHGLSVENTKFLKLCLDLQPTLRKLVMLAKKWADYLNYENISTYALVMMGIFYMQVNKYLLSVEDIRKLEKRESRTISGWKTLAHNLSVSKLREHLITYPHQVDVLAKAFFEYYAKFDFNTYVVCPLLGRVVMKSHFLEHHGSQLPVEMDAYLDQLEGEDPEYFRANSLMCIQDPFDLSHNLTKAVQQGTLSRFQNLCRMTAEHIQL